MPSFRPVVVASLISKRMRVAAASLSKSLSEVWKIRELCIYHYFVPSLQSSPVL